MEIYLIRHTAPAVATGFIYGRTDVALADTFELETAAIIRQLPPKIDVVFSSPSSRCTLLASAISEDFIIDEDLYELNFGRWEGKTWDTINLKESTYWMDDFVNRSPPGGETMLQMHNRATRFWNGLIRLQYETVVVVTHGGVIRALWAEVNAAELKNAFSIKVDYGAVIKITKQAM